MTLEGPANAVTTNRDSKLVAVAGRNGKSLSLPLSLSASVSWHASRGRRWGKGRGSARERDWMHPKGGIPSLSRESFSVPRP